MTTANAKPKNQLNGVLDRIESWPSGLRLRTFDFLFGRFSRAYATVGVRAARIADDRVELRLKNGRAYRNHVGGIHGVLCELPAEYAAGILVGQWVPASTVVVVKAMHSNLHKPIRGDIRATATLPRDRLVEITNSEKGEIVVPVEIVDETGDSPMNAEFTMAWFARKKKNRD